MKTNYFVLGASTLAFAILAVALQTTTGQAASNSCNYEVKPTIALPPDISQADYKPNLQANVLVTVAPSGYVVSVKLVKPSGSTAFDKATMDAAQKSTYRPARENCKNVQSTYMFHAQTGANPQ